MSETRLSFKEMCAKFDVTPRTLRYYEYIELSAARKGRPRAVLWPARSGADDADPARAAVRLQP